MAIEDKKSTVPPATSSGGEKTLYDCMKLFSVPETLEEGNEWYCNVCKEHKRATKKMECYRVPKYLVIHLKRFKDAKSTYYNSGSGKNSTKIIFPLDGLDLSTYVTKNERPDVYLNGKTAEEVFEEISASKGEKLVDEDEDTKMKIDSMDEGEKNALPKGVTRIEVDGQNSLIYDCYAVSNHFGNVGFGHYTAYAKNEISKRWYCFDDSSVSEVNPHSVITEAAYLLFYKKRE
jgi:ubiquitin carboxyl-terminal hydrolase 4/11/15